MIITHAGKAPRIDPTAWVAPDATVCGDVEIAAGARVLHGARIVGEAGGAICIGRNVIVMENAVVRAGLRHPCNIGDHCLIGPHAHVTGATIEEQCFIATGASIFHGAHVGKGSVVRVDGIVHLKTRLEPGAVVPIKWIALGDPAQMFPPEQHEELSVVLRALNFSMTVYGIDPATPERMKEVTRRLSDALGAHKDDTVQE
jgi:carbonic anhydrase/acetyltransferase-like protein (isoleucine patch superfamily)